MIESISRDESLPGGCEFRVRSSRNRPIIGARVGDVSDDPVRVDAERHEPAATVARNPPVRACLRVVRLVPAHTRHDERGLCDLRTRVDVIMGGNDQPYALINS